MQTESAMQNYAEKIFGTELSFMSMRNVTSNTCVYGFKDNSGNHCFLQINSGSEYRAIKNALTEDEKVFVGYLHDLKENVA